MWTAVGLRVVLYLVDDDVRGGDELKFLPLYGDDAFLDVHPVRFLRELNLREEEAEVRLGF